MSLCGAAPHLGPRELGGSEGLATGPPGPGYLQLQQMHWTQRRRHTPREASERPQKALHKQWCSIDPVVVTPQYVSLSSLYLLECVKVRTHSYQRGLFWDCQVAGPLWLPQAPVSSGPPDSGC